MLDAPDDVRRALERLVDELRVLAPEPHALFVYGSVAKGTYRRTSDVNLGVVLGDPSPPTLRAMGPMLRRARNDVGVRPYFLARDEITRLTDVFPVRMLDMRAHHQILHGPDPFVGIEVTAEHLRLRVEQELRNHLIRLRHHTAFAADDGLANARAIVGAMPALAVELSALLQVVGREAPPPGVRASFEAAASSLGFAPSTLGALADVHEGAEPDDAVALVDGLHALLDAAVRCADAYEVDGMGS